MESDLTDKERKKIIYRLMNCHDYSRARAELEAARILGEFTGYVKWFDNAKHIHQH